MDRTADIYNNPSYLCAYKSYDISHLAHIVYRSCNIKTDAAKREKKKLSSRQQQNKNVLSSCGRELCDTLGTVSIIGREQSILNEDTSSLKLRMTLKASKWTAGPSFFMLTEFFSFCLYENVFKRVTICRPTSSINDRWRNTLSVLFVSSLVESKFPCDLSIRQWFSIKMGEKKENSFLFSFLLLLQIEFWGAESGLCSLFDDEELRRLRFCADVEGVALRCTWCPPPPTLSMLNEKKKGEQKEE